MTRKAQVKAQEQRKEQRRNDVADEARSRQGRERQAALWGQYGRRTRKSTVTRSSTGSLQTDLTPLHDRQGSATGQR